MLDREEFLQMGITMVLLVKLSMLTMAPICINSTPRAAAPLLDSPIDFYQRYGIKTTRQQKYFYEKLK